MGIFRGDSRSWPALEYDSNHGNAELVGEPFDHRTCKVTNVVRASYAAFFQKNGKFYEGDNMTMPEFKAFDPSVLP